VWSLGSCGAVWTEMKYGLVSPAGVSPAGVTETGLVTPPIAGALGAAACWGRLKSVAPVKVGRVVTRCVRASS